MWWRCQWMCGVASETDMHQLRWVGTGWAQGGRGMTIRSKHLIQTFHTRSRRTLHVYFLSLFNIHLWFLFQLNGTIIYTETPDYWQNFSHQSHKSDLHSCFKLKALYVDLYLNHDSSCLIIYVENSMSSLLSLWWTLWKWCDWMMFCETWLMTGVTLMLTGWPPAFWKCCICWVF